MDKEDKLFIKDLNVRTRKGYICVRIMRKWNYDGNVPNGPVIYIGLILADEKGDSIYAQIPGADFHRLGSQLLLDNVYTIRKFSVRVCKPGYVPLDAQLMIQFTSFTTITPSKVPTTLFPKIAYKITHFNQIRTTGDSANKYIDVLGIVTAEGPVKTACPKGRDYVSTLKEITIKNLSDTELTVTLWEHHVQQFALPSSSAGEPVESVVVLFCGCVAKKIFNRTQLNAGNACRWFINPNIPEAQAFYDRLRKEPIPVHRQAVSTSAAPAIVQPKIMEHKTLAELNVLNPYDFPEQGYKCTVTITEIPALQEWWYMGCEVCKKRLRNNGGTYYCAKCKCNGAVPLYKLSFSAADDTAHANFFCYDVVARQIIRRNCDSLLRAINNAAGLPDQITRAVGRTFTFAVGLTDQSYYSMDNRVYCIENCTFRPDGLPAAIEHAPAMNAPAQGVEQSAEKDNESVSTQSPNTLAIQDKQFTPSPQVAPIQDIPDATPPPRLHAEETPEKQRDTISSAAMSHDKLSHRSVRKRLSDSMLSDPKENVAVENPRDEATKNAGKKLKTTHTSGQPNLVETSSPSVAETEES